MKIQRTTTNLGINHSRNKEEIYKYIEVNFGAEKKCCRSANKNKYGLQHIGPNPLPIRNFALLINKCVFDNNGRIIECKKIPLQSACIVCDKNYRRKRIEKSRDVFSKISDDEIYNYYLKNYGKTKKCSVCNNILNAESFSISRSMETGLHNQCKFCAKQYSEAVGNRWVVYSPQGRNRIKLSDDIILKSPSKDHIWPLSKGGSDNAENIVFMERSLNSSKSNSIPREILTPKDLKKTMISKRYWPIFEEAINNNWSIEKFNAEMSKAVNDLIKHKSELSDVELTDFFTQQKIENNTKHNIQRAVRKFRTYCNNSKSLKL